MTVIGILGKNDVGKSLFCTLGLRDRLSDAFYFVTDGELSLSLSSIKDKIKHKSMKSIADLTKLADNIKSIKENILIVDHLGSLVDQVLCESSLDDNNPNFNFMLGSKVRTKVALPLTKLIQNCRIYNKTLVLICPLDYNTTDDLTKGSVSFDTRTTQDVFFNQCDVIVHLKRKTYKACKTFEELFADLIYVFHYPHEITFVLKDKPHAKFNKKVDNSGDLYNLLYQIENHS